MKSLTKDLTYTGVSVEQVSEMLGSTAFREAVCDAQHVVRRDVTITGNGAGRVVTLDYSHATDKVPAVAKKLVGSEIQIIQKETWPTSTNGDVVVTIPGKPGDVKGTVALAQVGDDVVQSVRLAIKVSVPLMGGKIEDMLVDLLGKALAKEHEVGRAWLAGGAR